MIETITINCLDACITDKLQKKKKKEFPALFTHILTNYSIFTVTRKLVRTSVEPSIMRVIVRVSITVRMSFWFALSCPICSDSVPLTK